MYQKYKSAELVKPSGLDLKDRLVGVQRVTKVTKGGRAFGFSAIVVVGDEAGVVGQGLGKSKDVASAIAKAVEDAKKNLVRIPLIKGTLPHEQKGKYGGARVNIIPAAPGTGVIAGGAVRTVLEAVGVHDVLSKSQGSSNPHNVVKATFDALLQLRDAKSIARERGISLSKVFNGYFRIQWLR
jgi:small subunit ribosomal protein S5